MASVTINVLDPEFYVDPWQAYRWLRDEAPVYWDPVQKLWVISRYDDVLDVEKDTPASRGSCQPPSPAATIGWQASEASGRASSTPQCCR